MKTAANYCSDNGKYLITDSNVFVCVKNTTGKKLRANNKMIIKNKQINKYF